MHRPSLRPNLLKRLDQEIHIPSQSLRGDQSSRAGTASPSSSLSEIEQMVHIDERPHVLRCGQEVDAVVVFRQSRIHRCEQRIHSLFWLIVDEIGAAHGEEFSTAADRQISLYTPSLQSWRLRQINTQT